MNLLVVTPHFEPDTAPTGVVVSKIVRELVARGHRIEIVTSLPWYREHQIEEGWDGFLHRVEDAPWGRIDRIHPFPTRNKRNLARRALAFGAFSALAAGLGGRGPRVDGVLAVSPPLTLGLTAWTIALRRGRPLVLNIQDVYPDVAIELGALRDPRLVSAARRLERRCYSVADAVTVLSDDLRANVAQRVDDPDKVRVIPNFVDTESITPGPRANAYRQENGLGDRTVVMYAGNVGLSQSLDRVLDAATALSYDDDVVFVVNGAGAARDELQTRARGMRNVVFVDPQPAERLGEVLSAADIHLVPLRSGLAKASVPSKTYSILAAGRPLIAAVDQGSEVARTVTEAGAGLAIPPDDAEALTKAIRTLVDAPGERAEMGASARRWVERWASPAAVAVAYEELFAELRSRR